MSETNILAPEPTYGEPIEKSEVSTPLTPGNPPSELPETPPEPKPEPEPAKAEPQPKPREDPRDQRIRQQNARIATEARRADALAKELSDLRQAATPPGDAPKPADQSRNQADFDRAVQQRTEQQAFVAECNKLADAGAKEFPDDFQATVGTMLTMIDGVDPQGVFSPAATGIIEAAMETDRAAAVLHHLGKNPAEAMRIAALTPAKMGAAVAKVAASLSAAAVEAAAPKPVSRAPAPIDPVAGNARAEAGALGPKDTGEWMKWRDAQIKASRAR